MDKNEYTTLFKLFSSFAVFSNDSPEAGINIAFHLIQAVRHDATSFRLEHVAVGIG